MRRQKFVNRIVIFCLLLLPGQVISDGTIPGWNELVYLIYRIEVTNYCGLTTDQVIAGFHLQRKTMLDQYRLEKPLIESARSEARKLSYEEWGNRGLGGFRPWCRNEATLYANQFVRALNPAQK